MLERIKNFIFVELIPTELEEEYRAETFVRDKRITSFILLLTSILVATFIILDLTYYFENKNILLWTSSRIFALVAMLVCVWLIHRTSNVHHFDQIVIIIVFIDIIQLLIINATRHIDYFPIVLWDIFTLFGIYFFIPISLRYKILLTSFHTVCGIGIWLIYRSPVVNQYETSAVLLVYLLANIFGIFVSGEENQIRRHNFILLKKEKEISKELGEKTEALEEAREEMKNLAMTDFLTGLGNRRFFLNQLSIEIERTKRYGIPFAILLLDMDNLKEINDVFGHDAGDLAITALARECASLLRSNDLFARFGGDEFIVLLQDVNIEKAQEAAERIRKTIEELEIDYEGKTINTTVSIGIADSDDGKITKEAIIKKADTALYESKMGGKNRVSFK